MLQNKDNKMSNKNNWSDEMAGFHKTPQPSSRHSHHRNQMSDYRDKIPPNEDQGVVPYENEEIVDSEWEDFEKLLR